MRHKKVIMASIFLGHLPLRCSRDVTEWLFHVSFPILDFLDKEFCSQRRTHEIYIMTNERLYCCWSVKLQQQCSDIRGWIVTPERISSYQAGREFPFKHLQNSQSIKVQQFWNISLIALFSSISFIEMSISHILGFFFITNL